MTQSTNNSKPVIALQDLRKRFGLGDAEHYALDGVTLTIERGEFIAIMGPSGCGKTTLLNVLGLLDDTTEGSYELDGKSVDTLSQRRKAHIRSEQIGFIFQSFNLIPRLTVIENVALPLLYKGASKLSRLKKASKILGDFHLTEREYYKPHQLSGGQTQRVAIARALVNEPSIILADEPTGNLDSHASHIIMEELSDLHQKGNTIIMVTHNPNLTTYASRVITMLDGKIDTDTTKPKEKQATPKPSLEVAENNSKDAPKLASPAERRLRLADIVDEKEKEEKARAEAAKKITQKESLKATSESTTDAEKESSIKSKVKAKVQIKKSNTKEKKAKRVAKKVAKKQERKEKKS